MISLELYRHVALVLKRGFAFVSLKCHVHHAQQRRPLILRQSPHFGNFGNSQLSSLCEQTLDGGVIHTSCTTCKDLISRVTKIYLYKNKRREGETLCVCTHVCAC